MQNTKNKNLTIKLCESAVMIALATILSLIKLADLPAGGSITPASMLPLLLIAYRHGTSWGLLTGLVHGVLQFLLGTSVLSYVTGAASVAAVIILDYLLAFALIGLAGSFAKLENQRTGLVLGAFLAGAVRYLCHVIAGATVWAGLSIPTAGAITYSLIYNATYMIPETLVLCAAAFYIGSSVDFRKKQLAPIKSVQISKGAFWCRLSAGAVLLCALIYDIVAVFPNLQDGDSGEFANGIANVDWVGVSVVSGAALVLSGLLLFLSSKLKKSDK